VEEATPRDPEVDDEGVIAAWPQQSEIPWHPLQTSHFELQAGSKAILNSLKFEV
jgi:hypothetical protein